MIDQPIVKDDCCAGCVCARCGRSAFQVEGSMNDMGWCDACETNLHVRIQVFGPKRPESTEN
jgi:hypothetical protein